MTCPKNKARPIRHPAQVPDRNGKIFYTSITSLSHISKVSGHEAAHGWRRCRSGGHHPDSSAVWSVRLRAAGGFSRLYISLQSSSSSLLWITALYHKRIAHCGTNRFFPPINERRCSYAVFDPHYFSPESAQDPHQPLQLRTVTAEWKPFSKPLPTGSKAS